MKPTFFNPSFRSNNNYVLVKTVKKKPIQLNTNLTYVPALVKSLCSQRQKRHVNDKATVPYWS